MAGCNSRIVSCLGSHLGDGWKFPNWNFSVDCAGDADTRDQKRSRHKNATINYPKSTICHKTNKNKCSLTQVCFMDIVCYKLPNSIALHHLNANSITWMAFDVLGIVSAASEPIRFFMRRQLAMNGNYRRNAISVAALGSLIDEFIVSVGIIFRSIIKWRGLRTGIWDDAVLRGTSAMPGKVQRWR